MKIPRSLCAVAVAAAAGLVHARSAQGVVGTITEISPLTDSQGGVDPITPLAINNAGLIAGSYSFYEAHVGTYSVAVSAKASTGASEAVPPPANAGSYARSQAAGVNASGTIVGTYSDSNTGGQTRGFTQAGTAASQLLVGTGSTTNSAANATNDAGTIVGSTYSYAAPTYAMTTVAFYDPAGGSITSVPLPAGDANSVLTGINAKGLSVGLVTADTTGLSASSQNDLAVFNASNPSAGMTDVATPTGSDYSLTNDNRYEPKVNGAGVAILTAQDLNNSNALQAFKYNVGTGTYTLLLSGTTGGQTAAAGIDAAGDIVGTDNGHAAIWLANTTAALDLNTYLPANSGWTLATATGINDVGDVIGTGIFDGTTEGYVLDIAAPEPTSALLLSAPVALLIMGRRRRSPITA